MTPEQARELVRLACCSAIGRGSPQSSLILDDPTVCDLAQQEGICSFLAHGQPSNPAARGVVAQTFAQNARYLQLLEALDAALVTAGLTALVLKGAALLHTTYAGHVSWRPLSDVDLLVRGSDRLAVEDLLRHLGFNNSTRGGPVWMREGLTVDLHDHLVEGRIRSRGQAFRFDDTHVWSTAGLVPGYRALRMLSPSVHFLFLAIHALKHAHTRLIWLVDLALLLPHLDPLSLERVARATGCQRVLALTLCCLEQILQTTPSCRLPLPRLNWLERRYLVAVCRRRSPVTLGELVMAFSIPTLRGRLVYLYELCFPAREILRRLYPRTPSWLLPWVRFTHLIRMAREEAARWLSVYVGEPGHPSGE